MTYALSVKPPSVNCWRCDHFLPINPLELVQGYCRKGAPCGLDLYGAVSGSLLTTKGDLLTRDLANLVRLPVGANEAVLTADILAADGIKWAPETLTTKGDLLTRNATVKARLPVGANGLVLTADSTVAEGIKWAAAPSLVIQHEYQGIHGGDQVAGLVTFTREGYPPDITANKVILSLAASYDENPSDMAPFVIPVDPTSQIIAIQICYSAAAVIAAAVGPAPFVRVLFYEWVTGAGHNLLGQVDVPLDPASVTPLDSLVVPNFSQALYVLPAPLSGFTSGVFGWMLDINGADNQMLHAILNASVRIYATTDALVSGFALAAKKSDGFEDEDFEDDPDENLDDEKPDLISGDLLDPADAKIIAEETNAALQIEVDNFLQRKQIADIEDPFRGNTDPNVITAAASFAKWCLIKVAPNEWCGEFKPASHTVPAIPPFVYPVPTPP